MFLFLSYLYIINLPSWTSSKSHNCYQYCISHSRRQKILWFYCGIHQLVFDCWLVNQILTINTPLLLLLIIISNIQVYYYSNHWHWLIILQYCQLWSLWPLTKWYCQVLLLLHSCQLRLFWQPSTKNFYQVSILSTIILKIPPNLLHVSLIDLGRTVWPYFTSFGTPTHIFMIDYNQLQL